MMGKKYITDRKIKIFWIFVCVAFSMLVFLCFPNRVCAGIELNSKPLTLTMVADTTSGLGHAFLIVRNNTGENVYIGEYVLPSGQQATLGLRGVAPWVKGCGGSYINIELAFKESYKNFDYVTCEINQEKLTEIAEYFQKSSYYETDATVLVHNCTTFASVAWNMACPLLDKVVPDNLPADLKIQIKMLFDSKSGTSLVDSGLVDESDDKSYTNVFYLDKQGNLTPIAIGETISSDQLKIKTTSSKITLSWGTLKGVPNEHTKSRTEYASGYIIEYKMDGEKSSHAKYVDGVTRKSYTVSNLKEGKKYKIRVCPAYCYKADGKTAYCRGGGVSKTAVTNKIFFDKEMVSVRAGESVFLGISELGTTTTYPLKCESTDATVATISDDGKISAYSGGETIVSISYGGSKAKCRVSVADLQLNKKTMKVREGTTFQLMATVEGKSQVVTWASTSKAIATVKNGLVTAKKLGTCTIKATANGITATCKVTVLPAKWKVAYKEFLSELTSSYGMSFELAYITNDSIPELLISEGWYEGAMVRGYTFTKNKVVQIFKGGCYGTIGYAKKKSLILVSVNRGRYAYEDFFKFDKNLNAKRVYYFDASYGSTATFSINGKKVSKDTYKKKYDAIFQRYGFQWSGYSSERAIKMENIEKLLTNPSELFGKK